MVASGSTVVGWLVGEVFDLGIGEAIHRVIKQRVLVARKILQDQLATGESNITDAADKDEAAAMVFEYIEASRIGCARFNLRMLAQIMAGELATPPVYASNFLRWSHILADLSREEIIVLANLHKVHHAVSDPTNYEDSINKINANLLRDMQQKSIVSTQFELYSILAALQRTGLVIYSAGGFGGGWYFPTPRLDELLGIVNVEQVISETNR
jgi:hypothetical protein